MKYVFNRKSVETEEESLPLGEVESDAISEDSDSDSSYEISDDEEDDVEEDHDEPGDSSRFTITEKALIIDHFKANNMRITSSNIEESLFKEHNDIANRFNWYFRSKFPDRPMAQWLISFRNMIRQWWQTRQ